jgi:hypothetical protein
MTTSVRPERTAEMEPIDHDREDASRVDEPTGEPPDDGLAFDPAMTEGDEANIPADSEADPDRRPETDDRDR